jgi:hypothetical protein
MTMTPAETLAMAKAIGACRRAATAGGHGLRVIEIEILLLSAGGVDAAADINAACGGSRTNATRSLRFLSGRDSSGSPLRGGIRSSPFRLIEHRKHPHRRGHQYRLSNEGIALFSQCVGSASQPDWT